MLQQHFKADLSHFEEAQINAWTLCFGALKATYLKTLELLYYTPFSITKKVIFFFNSPSINTTLRHHGAASQSRPTSKL